MNLTIELTDAQHTQLVRDTKERNDIERSLNLAWKDHTPEEFLQVFITHRLDARSREHERQRRHAEVEASMKVTP